MSAPDQDIPGVIAFPPLIYLGPLILGLVLRRLRPIPFVARPLAGVLGWPLLLGGGTLLSWARRTMVEAGTPLDPNQPVKRFVTWGPFARSRNPLYLALTMIYTGIALLARSLWALLFLAPVLAIMRQGVIEREERYLERRFGDEYRQYKARVPRWM